MSTDALLAMSELIRLRAKASEPLDLDEMAELAAALECHAMSVRAIAPAIRRPVGALDIPPLPLFSVIHGGRQ